MKQLTHLLLLLPGLLLLPHLGGAEEWRWDFDSDPLDKWEKIGTGEWRQTELPDRRGVLELSKSGKPPAKPVRRPANILLAPTPAVGDFTVDLIARSLQFERKGADIVIIFGYQDPFNFYYAHISNDVNPVHHVIMKVEGDKEMRSAIQLEEKPVAALKDGWQRIRLTRSSEGDVKVYVDDMENPTLSAKDAKWLSGRIGVGSFNDAAQFDAIKVTGQCF
jgi:hypothetical protein